MRIKILAHKEKLKGGAGDNRPDSAFNPKQLAAGIDDESEHSTDIGIDKEIAKDHLTQDPEYYKKLKAANLDEQALAEEEKKSAVMVAELKKEIAKNKDKIWVFFDTETTGMNPSTRQLTEIAAIAVRPSFDSGDAKPISQYHKKIALTPQTLQDIEKPHVPLHKRDKSVKDILTMTQYFTSKGDKVAEDIALRGFVDFIKSLESEGQVVLLAHNAKFDRQFITVRSGLYGIEKLNTETVDTLQLVYDFFYPLLVVNDKKNLLSKLKTPKGMVSFTIGTLTAALDINNKDWHNALADVTASISITQSLIKYVLTHEDVDVRPGVEKSIKLQRTRASYGK